MTGSLFVLSMKGSYRFCNTKLPVSVLSCLSYLVHVVISLLQHKCRFPLHETIIERKDKVKSEINLKHLSRDMTKPTKWLSLRCPHEESLGP